jgi:uncharacterized delta-60 repeat protein
MRLTMILRSGTAIAQRSVAILLTLISLAIFDTSVLAAPGDLDSTFGAGGHVSPTLLDNANAMALQPDGKIVVVGLTEGGVAVARFNPDGSADLSFGQNGKTKPLTSVGQAVAWCLAIQPDGGIVTGGWISDGGNGIGFSLFRFKSNGKLDPSFGSTGKVITHFFNFNDTIYKVAIQPDGKIIAVGDVGEPGVGHLFGVARYNPNGTLDSSFGTGGKVTSNFGDADAFDGIVLQAASDLALLANGNIVVVGYALKDFGGYNFGVIRYLPNGNLDQTFGNGGFVTTDFNGSSDFASCVAIQADGKIVVGGYAFDRNTGDNDMAVARYNTDGTLDATFGGFGRLISGVMGTDFINTIAVDQSGKILVAGGAPGGPIAFSDFTLERLNPDGTPDLKFGQAGFVRTDLVGDQEGISSIAIQPDGKIVAVGSISQTIGSTGSHWAITRYNNFDLCLQKGEKQNILRASSVTGDYLLSRCSETVLAGTGTLSLAGAKLTLTDNKADRNINASFSIGQNTGNATIFLTPSSGTSQTIVINQKKPRDSCSCE